MVRHPAQTTPATRTHTRPRRASPRGNPSARWNPSARTRGTARTGAMNAGWLLGRAWDTTIVLFAADRSYLEVRSR